MKNLLFVPLLLSFVSLFGQTHWSTISSGTNEDLLSISFGNEQVGYISGKNNLLLKTMDSGKIWNILIHAGIDTTPFAKDIIDIQFVDADNGYAILGAYPTQQYIGKLFETADGGTTWMPSNDSVTIAAVRSYFFEKGNGYLLGSAFFAGNIVAKMKQDLWTNYSNFSYDPLYFNYGIDFSDTLNGIIGGNDGYFYRTFNGGQTWDTVYSGSDSIIYSLKYLNDSTIIAATGHGNRSVIISRDGGFTWNDEVNSISFSYPIMESISANAGDSIIAVGHPTNLNSQFATNGFIYWFDGIQWQQEMFGPALHDVAKQSSKAAFVVGDSGLVLTNKLPITALPKVNSILHKINIYPNPTSGKLYLQYDQLQINELKLIDISGKLIKVFKSRSKQLDVSDLSKGIYFLNIKAKDGVLSQKIIIE